MSSEYSTKPCYKCGSPAKESNCADWVGCTSYQYVCSNPKCSKSTPRKLKYCFFWTRAVFQWNRRPDFEDCFDDWWERRFMNKKDGSKNT